MHSIPFFIGKLTRANCCKKACMSVVNLAGDNIGGQEQGWWEGIHRLKGKGNQKYLPQKYIYFSN
jgi:hypothetical protein